MEIISVRCRIPELVRKRGKTQQWLADQIGISKTQLSDYVRMRHKMNVDIAKNIAVTLGCQVDDLFIWDRREE